MSLMTAQWVLLIAFSLFLYAVSPWARTAAVFFRGTSATDRRPGFWALTSSLVISWIFAKSVTNAANLGQAFGIVGGLAYATYYLSFLVAGIVIFRMRTQGGFRSIHHFLLTRFGRSAVRLFSLLIAIRLFNEVWSNTSVIGLYFGEPGGLAYYAAVAVFTVLTLAYSLKGGLRSSIVTDVIQFGLFLVLLAVLIFHVIPAVGSVETFLTSGTWKMSTGVNLLLAALLQIFSYPFHDPVMTDRGFISAERTTLRAFIASAVLGVLCITLFSFAGIYAGLMGLQGDAAVQVSRTFGVVMALAVNLIMVTSAASTVDSTFASAAKLGAADLGNDGAPSVARGRWIMTLTALLGSLPLLLSPEIISATTVSGTMVIGLAPVFLLWWLPVPRISFHLSFWTGIGAGLVLVLGVLPQGWLLTDGKYADLLAINLYGTLACFALYLIPYGLRRYLQSNRVVAIGLPVERQRA
ncbi:MAG: sodium:solute symporter [Candidatus Lambdaproteobacteria bacterium]|nr:sodium:solute symporter [Candidatus Lambdaproteobacteria bacterium]